MKRYPRIFRFFIIMLVVTGNLAYGQSRQGADSAGVKKILDRAITYQKTYASEKLYLNFDKPYYAVGDTAWLKAYVLRAAGGAPANSAKLYIDLMDNAGTQVQQLVLPVFDGLAQGYFALDEKRIPEGSYTIRAYTNWQQNFGADYFFYKQLSVGKLGGKTWLLTEQHQLDTDSGRVTLAMRLNDARGLPLVARRVGVRILDGGKSILKSEMATGVDGTLTGRLMLPAKANKHNLSIQVDDVNDKTQHVSFPFYPSGAGGDIDLQFMPEGGKLIAGLYNRVAFKAIGEDGLSREVRGVIVDGKGTETAELQSIHNGMGSFVLVPQAGETYTARITVNGKQKGYTLPAANARGIALRVDGTNHADELYVYLSATPADTGRYILMAQSRDKVYFGSALKLNAGGFFNTRISKDRFPTGIINLTVLGANNKPVAQRSVFVDRGDALQISALPGHASYNPHDSVALSLHVLNRDGSPAQGSFSVSVTDDAQVRDAVQTDNIVSHMLLAAELNGNIENPAWYFERGDRIDSKLKERALDNLLLTQGWQGYDWNRIDQPIPAPIYQPEPDISVSGQLKNLFGKPAKGLKVNLLGKGKQSFFQDTLSDNNGRFAFRNLPLVDSVTYLVKLHNKSDNSAAADITVDEFKASTMPLIPLPRLLPWNLNSDTTLLNLMNKANERKQQADVFVVPDGKLLKQVDIKATRQIKDLGPEFAVELININEAQLITEKKKSLMDVIYKYVPGLKETHLFQISIYSKVKMYDYTQFVNGMLMIRDIVADGQMVAAGQYAQSPTDRYNFMKEYLNTLGADDVKSISVYRGQFQWLVIKTRSGKGIFAGTSLGTYAYRPLPMQLPKAFYRPKYNVKNTQPDLRSTIHWEPNLVTDNTGNATLSFYAADKPATYTVVIEGTDMQGHFGVSTSKISVSQGTAGVK